jgi:hypothetical protein
MSTLIEATPENAASKKFTVLSLPKLRSPEQGQDTRDHTMTVIKPTKEELTARRAAVKARQQAEAAKLRKAASTRIDAKTEKRALTKAVRPQTPEPADIASVAAATAAVEQGKNVARAIAGAKTPKVILSARDNLAKAFDDMGGVPALVIWGRSNPTEFYRLWARLIPKEAAEAPSMPLETLLEKLATREEMSVGAAAMDIGMELIERGRLGAELEDLENLTKGTLQ